MASETPDDRSAEPDAPAAPAPEERSPTARAHQPEGPAMEAADFDRLKSYLKDVPKGERIFEQGDEGTTMFFIQEGRVRITKVSATRTQPLAVLEPGSFFGEMAVVNGEPRSARAEALTACRLLEIDRHTLDAFLGSHPSVGQRMIATLAQRLRDTDMLVERLLAGDPALQVVDAILEMTEDAREEPPYIRDVHHLMVESATDPTLLRWVLTRLKRGRFISVDEDGIRVGQRERLKQYQNFLHMQQDFLNQKR